jgi:hypothetical protein
VIVAGVYGIYVCVYMCRYVNEYDSGIKCNNVLDGVD